MKLTLAALALCLSLGLMQSAIATTVIVTKPVVIHHGHGHVIRHHLHKRVCVVKRIVRHHHVHKVKRCRVVLR